MASPVPEPNLIDVAWLAVLCELTRHQQDRKAIDVTTIEHEPEIREIQRHLAEIHTIAERLPERHRQLAATHLQAESVLLGWGDINDDHSSTLEERLFWRRAAREEREALERG